MVAGLEGGGERCWRAERVLMLGNCWPEKFSAVQNCTEYYLLKGLGKLGDSSGLMLSLKSKFMLSKIFS